MIPHDIRPLREKHLPEAMALVWDVFQQFEAPDYAPAGVEEFRGFIALPSIRERMAEGLRLWGCFRGERLIGVIAMRPPAHVTLLFVHPAFHRQGVARALWETALREFPGEKAATVNASPYAREAYRRLGFAETGGEQEVNGIRFIPMEYAYPRE